MRTHNYLFVLLFLILANELQSQNIPENFDEKYYSALEYRHIGPFRGGRSCAVTGVEGIPNLYYMGTTGGGVWKTENGGNSWENISDGFFGGSIGAIAVSQSDNNVIYVGGGEKTVRGNVSHGYGVWKTENAGRTWEQKGLKESRHISRVRIHPENPNIAYAAVMGNLFKSHPERGIFKTTDGGDTWEKVLFVNDDVGAVDLCLDPNNPRIMYASTWRIRRTPYSLSSGGQGCGIWKSTDSGETWTEITGNKGLPTDTLGIIGLAVSPANSDRIWAIVESKTGGLFRSDDAGETWRKLNTDRSLRQRAWYYTRVYADTKDPDVCYVMNVSYHKSTDGGRTFTSHRAPHGDHHDLWIAPEDPNRMVIADDGGAQVSYNGGLTWSTYMNQPTAQFYRVTTDNHFPYRIYAAQQDNSTIRINHRSSGGSISEDDWESTAGGESAHLAPDPKDPEIVYGGSYDGFFIRKDHRTNLSRAINVWPDNPMGHGAENMKYRFQWNFPIFFSPHNPNKLYTASNHLHYSLNEGQSWKTISPDLTRNDPSKLGPSGGPITKDNTSVEYYCTIFAAAESPLKEGILWTGSDDGLIHISQDGGENWTNVTPKDLPEWTMINCIDADPFNEGGMYFAATSYKLGDFKPYLYKTSDYGKTWKKIVKGIEKEHFTRAIRADKTKAGLLYAGTETGMYISFDDGNNWRSFQQNLPIVPITDLALKDDNLIVATQGRSLWIVDDLTVLHQLYEERADDEMVLLKPMDTHKFQSFFRGNPGTGGLNKKPGVTAYYYLEDDPADKTVSFKVLDANGKMIKTFSNKSKDRSNKIEVKQGNNTFNWNLSYPGAKDFEGMIFWWGSLAGPKAIPGEYTVRMIVGQDSTEQQFNVVADPRLQLSQDDYKANFDFINSVNDKVTEAHEAIINIRQVKNLMNPILAKLKENKVDTNLVKLGKDINDRLSKVEKELYQTQNRSGQDPLNFPIRLTNKLAHINSLTGMSDYPPTDQAIETRNELSKMIDEQLSIYWDVLNNDLKQFNKKYRDLELDVLWIDAKQKSRS